jgi:lysozyme family protein
MASKAPPFKTYAVELGHLWDSMVIKSDKLPSVNAAANRLVASKGRYQEVEASTGVPWWMTALIGEREAGAAIFSRHLHNGDPMKRGGKWVRTVQVPKGRPKSPPPWTWEFSATDALIMMGFAKIKDWTLEQVMYSLEAYNGWGYYLHHVHSAYLWSFSKHYAAGKYVADRVWGPRAVDQQIGTMPILKAMMEVDRTIAPKRLSA